MNLTKDFYTGPEVARIMGYTRQRIWQLTGNGTIDAVRGPGAAGIYLYTRATVQDLLDHGLPNPRGDKE